MPILNNSFFEQDSKIVARELLGKVIRRKVNGLWFAAQVIETEAYTLEDKANHASLGFTEKRRALFMPAGTIYMYYARGGDSFNISTAGEGNAVLIKSAYPYQDKHTHPEMIQLMQDLNPLGDRLRPLNRLCAGQTLLCKSLDLRVPDWDQQRFNPQQFYIDDISYQPKDILQTKRLGIPAGRDEHLLYRFIDVDFHQFTTKPFK